MQENTDPNHIFNFAVDCEWGEWQVGQCSVTCGGGTRMNTRSKLLEEQFGGVCFGDEVLTESCSTEACPRKDASCI